jgi:hypothetical protein
VDGADGAFHGAFDRFVRQVCAEALARRAAEAWPGAIVELVEQLGGGGRSPKRYPLVN